MKFKGDWYHNGRLADTYKWPDVLKSNDKMDILSYEKDGSLAGCSGFTNYSINKDTMVTFAFSNPSIGLNKLEVGIGGRSVWDNMGNQNYDYFQRTIAVAGSESVKFQCRCTGSTTNHATVDIY